MLKQQFVESGEMESKVYETAADLWLTDRSEVAVLSELMNKYAKFLSKAMVEGIATEALVDAAKTIIGGV